jgi:small subunit ribosomal protein S28e
MANIPPGHFLLLYHASAASYTGKDFETFEAPFPLSNLYDYLELRYVGIKQKVLASCLVTINLEYIDIPDCKKGDDEIMIKAGDEVGIIPPVSSG